MRWLSALAAACALTGCAPSTSLAPPIPADGVHITGAITGVYPIANGGNCPVLDAVRELAISANPAAGQPYFGAAVENFDGPRTYTDVRWPPDGHSSLYVAVGDRVWRAESGLISVKSFGNASASGTLWAAHLHELNGTTTVNAAGSWTCQLLYPPPAPTPEPSPTPPVYPTLPPPPVGTPVARQVLPPATVLPVGELCTSAVEVFQDGNAGPLFCLSGALNIAAWNFFAQLQPRVMSLGPSATLAEIKAAICTRGGQNMTIPEEDSAYTLAAAYYDWIHGVAHGFDASAFMVAGGCP